MSTSSGVQPESGNRRRWIALAVVCIGMLMNTLDGSIVNVALPSIQNDLGFTQAGLAWVVDSYLIMFGSFMLMAGRLGDLIGRKKVFLGGVLLFTLASMACGIADSQTVLVAARFVQGAAAAVSSSVIIAIIITEFPDPVERAKAMSMYIFVAVGGGSLGLLAGGLLTEAIDWHWIFFINVPIGVVTMIAGRALLDENEGLGLRQGVDVIGSVLVTVALMSGIYGIITAHDHGWASLHTLVFGGAGVLLMAAFLAFESRVANPIMPLRIFRVPNLMASSFIRGLGATGMFSTFFLGSLYLERVKDFSPIEIGLAFLPMTLSAAALSTGLAARLIGRFGPRAILYPGLLLSAAGLGLFMSAGAETGYFPTLFFALVLLGLGAGSSFMALLTIAMADVPREDAGLASGIVNVSMQMFAAIGLAALGTVASSRTRSLEISGRTAHDAMVGGYHLAFMIAAGCALLGAVVAPFILRPSIEEDVDAEIERSTIAEMEPTA